MLQQYDSFQKLAKDNFDNVTKAFSTLTKAGQAVAAENADYAKKAFEQGTAHLEKLAGVRTLDKAIEVQTDFVKTSYDGFVAQATKISELVGNAAKEAYKPFESIVANATTAPKAVTK
jgi:hypothetical protein